MNHHLLQAQIAYMLWADRVILDAAFQLDSALTARDAGSSHGGILGTLQHMFRAETIWIERISGKGNTQMKDVRIPEDLSELSAEWPALHSRWTELSSDNQDWERLVTHTTMTGVTFTLPLSQIVLHVVNHSTLHRGQVMSMMRQASVAPPNTDLITYYRTHAAAAV